MPTPWRHPKHGTYYLKKRVPLDIKHLWTKPDPYQVLKRQIGVTTEADEQAFREVMEEFFPSGQNEFLDTQMAETLAHSRMQSEKAALSHRKRTAATWEKEKQPLAADTHPADF